jgi:hypothetical protein
MLWTEYAFSATIMRFADEKGLAEYDPSWRSARSAKTFSGEANAGLLKIQGSIHGALGFLRKSFSVAISTDGYTMVPFSR